MRGSTVRGAASTLLPSCLQSISAQQTAYQIYREHQISEQYLTMDFRNEASSWAIHHLAEDSFGDSPTSCAESSWDRAPDARGLGYLASVDALRDGRHRTPSPSIACIDPRLTVLWPSPPPASPSEESSVEGDWSAFDEWPEDPASACASEATTPALDGEAGSDGLKPGPTDKSPSEERRMTRSTVTTTRACAAPSKDSKEMVKGPDKTYAKWKCRAKGMVAPSGPSTRVSQAGRCPNPGPIDKEERWKAEGIEKIHMKLWKCRTGGCNKTFHRKGDAVRHLQTTARHNGKAVVCGCGAPFSRHDALKRHQRLCNGDVS